jgi:hypothetical protein
MIFDRGGVSLEPELLCGVQNVSSLYRKCDWLRNAHALVGERIDKSFEPRLH